MEVFKLFGSILIDNTKANESLKKTDEVAENSGNKMSNTFKKVGAAVIAAFSVQKIKEFSEECMEAYKVQVEAETKLETVMRQRMNSSDDSIQSVKDLTAAQQELGVVGDEVQMAGAQQLATFLNTDSALKTLIPAMNNLAVQQNGVNVSSSSMVSIGNLMGKVMQGSTSALTRVGITFDETQEKVLKYGNEQERAAMLAEVITQNVGKMNEEMAKTDDGKQQQAKNTLGDLQEVIGQRLIPAQTMYYTILAQIATFLVNTLLPVADNAISFLDTLISQFKEHKTLIDVIIGVLDVLTASFIAFKTASTITSVVQSFQEAKLALALFTASQEGATVAQSVLNGTLTLGETLVALLTGKVTLAQLASEAWTGAQTVLNGVLSANPIGLVVAAITGLIAIMVIAYNKCEWFRNMVNSSFNGISNTVGNVTSSIGSKFNSIHQFIDSCVNKFNDMRNKINSIFSSIRISLPHIPMPHFRINPAGWNIGDLIKGRIPSLGVSWYKKAMDDPMLLDGATIFGSANGKLLGGGEAGKEYITGEKGLSNIVSKVIDEKLNSNFEKQTSLLELMIELLRTISQKNTSIVLDDGTLVGKTIDKIDNELYRLQMEGARGL